MTLTATECVVADPQPASGAAFAERAQAVPARSARTLRRRLSLAVAVLALGAIYLAGAVIQGVHVNVPLPEKGGWWYQTDQGAYMECAREMYLSHYRLVGGRWQMPVYPFLQSLLYDPALTTHEYFLRGKYFNILLSLVLLGLTYGIVRRDLPPAEAHTLVLIVAFTVFVFKAGFVQCELLFYFLNFCAFLAFWKLFTNPSLELAAAGGIVAACAHLTKASVLPAAILFTLFFSVQQLVRLFSKHPSDSAPARGKTLGLRLLTVGLFLFAFVATLYPYISTSKRIFGHYFYNVTSTFWMWADSWYPGVAETTRAQGDLSRWPDLPADQLPSASKYLREHSLPQIAWRMVKGIAIVVGRDICATGYLKYLFLYTAFTLLLVAQHWRRIKELIVAKRCAVLLLFLGSYFAAYFLLYAWYTPIGHGPRFSLSQYLPALFSLMYLLSREDVRSLPLRLGRLQVTSAHLQQFAVCLLLLDVLFEVPAKTVWVYWGK